MKSNPCRPVHAPRFSSPGNFLTPTLAALALVCLTLPAFTADDTGGREYFEEHFSTDPADVDACKAKLLRIHEALSLFRQRNNGLWPDYLSQLVPTYLDQPQILECPFVRRSGRWNEWRRTLRGEVFRDPRSVTYSYELIKEPLENLHEAGVTNATSREYKFRQAALLASRGGDSNSVPVVRCLCHRPVLNLTASGSVYTSNIHWEDNFKAIVPHEELEPARIFAKEIKVALERPRTRRPAKSIPPRPAGLAPHLLDLTDHYNVALNETWHPGHENNDLAELLAAPRSLSGVEFDLRGLIQLRSDEHLLAFPASVRNIPIGRKAKALVFLHASAYQVTNGTQVATYLVHTSEGSTHEIPVRYGHDLCDWWLNPSSKSADHCDVAWRGMNGAARREKMTIQLFRSRWINPQPTATLQHLDFISTLSSSAPFLVAITAED